ncbi:MAG TPA: DNA primase [Bacilli bacterium]
MTIPEETIQKIREEADLVQIIGEFVKLEKRGNNYMGLCPFHPDHKPSLTVSPTKKIYTCFSCGATGNVFTFIQNYRNVPFLEAVRYVGEKCGIEVNLDGFTNYSQIYDKYYKILQTSANFYEFFLKNSSEGKEARKYLYKRNINDEIIKRFRIGLAPKDADLLFKTLLKEKFTPLDMIEAGVVRAGQDSGSYYDLFRNRIVFPLEDIDGKIVGFSGRIYKKNTDEPKYLNSSENKIFKKGKLLYNFFRNINEIRLKDEVYVFEGFMDVIAAYRAGINNAVATMGTALTAEQIQAIAKITKNAVICYDGDKPGIEATKRAIRLFSESGFNVKAVLLPEDLDPDDYVNRYGADKFSGLLKSAKSGIEYLYVSAKLNYDPKDINRTEAFKNDVFQSLREFNSSVLTEKFLKRLSDDLQVSFESLKADFDRLPVTEFIKPKPEEKQQTVKKRSDSREKKYLKTERELLKRAYQNKDICIQIFKELDACYVDFKNYTLLTKLYDYYQKNDFIKRDDLDELLKEEERTLLEEILQTNEVVFGNLDLKNLLAVMKEYEDYKKFKIIQEAVKENPNGENLSKFAKIRNETVIHTVIHKE